MRRRKSGVMSLVIYQIFFSCRRPCFALSLRSFQLSRDPSIPGFPRASQQPLLFFPWRYELLLRFCLLCLISRTNTTRWRKASPWGLSPTGLLRQKSCSAPATLSEYRFLAGLKEANEPQYFLLSEDQPTNHCLPFFSISCHNRRLSFLVHMTQPVLLRQIVDLKLAGSASLRSPASRMACGWNNWRGT